MAPQTATARIRFWIRAVAFLLLIMSKAYSGVILCKLSLGCGRYERALDFGNAWLVAGKSRWAVVISHVPDCRDMGHPRVEVDGGKQVQKQKRKAGPSLLLHPSDEDLSPGTPA